MARPEDGKRASVERRHPPDAETFGGRDEQRVGEAGPVLRGLGKQLARPDKVLVRRWDEADRPRDERLDHRHGRLDPELTLEQDVQLGQAQCAEHQWFVDPFEPRDRGSMVEVCGVGRGEDSRRVEEDRHLAPAAAPARLATGDRATVQRQPAMLAAPDPEERELGGRLV